MTKDVDIASNEERKRVRIVGSYQNESGRKEIVIDGASIWIMNWLTIQ